MRAILDDRIIARLLKMVVHQIIEAFNRLDFGQINLVDGLKILDRVYAKIINEKERILGRTARQNIIVLATIKNILTIATIQLIVLIATLQNVITILTKQLVLAIPAFQEVLARTAFQRVIIIPTIQYIGMITAL